MDLGFDGVHALVTGASGGIGFAITQLFLGERASVAGSCLTIGQQEHGARVTAQYNTGPGPLAKTKEFSDRLEIVQANVTQEAPVKEIFERGANFFKKEVQVLICECIPRYLVVSLSHHILSELSVNHGIFPPEDTDVVDMELSQWQTTIDVNLTGEASLCTPRLMT